MRFPPCLAFKQQRHLKVLAIAWEKWLAVSVLLRGSSLTLKAIEAKATQITKAFWTNGGGLPEKWLQTGLALSPLVGTSRVLFPIPKGAWPRHAHMQNLLDPYHLRSPCLTAWARACFEQGALSSILYLPGIVPVFSLPGDKMFQTTEISSVSLRPSRQRSHIPPF